MTTRAREPHTLETMKSRLSFAFIRQTLRVFYYSAPIILTCSVFAATNDLSGLLQKGLFEEEANRNLDAASAAYETLVKQFDKDRQIGATAVFRLGEVYRKQGKTNEAAAQYERIVRDFAEQTTLVTLSRQNLAGLGRKSARSERAETIEPIAEIISPEAQELARTKNILLKLQGWDLAQLRRLIPTLVPDAEFERLDNELSKYNPNQPVPDDVARRRKEVELQLNERAEVILETVRIRLKTLEDQVEKQAGKKAVANSNDAKSPITTVADEEEAEIRRIQAMIQNSPDLINGSPNVESPLLAAARHGRLRVVSFLLDNGADVNAVFGGKTALHNAVQFGNKAMVELLLARGASVDAKDGTGGTALHEAAQAGYLSIVEVLLKHKADLNARNSKQNGEQAPLHLATKNGHTTLIGFLLEHGDEVNRRDAEGQTPLHLAAQKGHNGLVERLLKAGAEANAANDNGDTPLMTAVSWGHSLSVKALLAANAKTDLADKKGRTALSYAAENGHVEIVAALLMAKADPNAGKMNLPLHFAIKSKSAEIVERLLKAEADANRACTLTWRRSGSGSYVTYGSEVTPLAVALDTSEDKPKLEIVKLLLRHKGDPNGTSVDGSALMLKAINDPEILTAFLEAGADANTHTGKGWPLLVSAVQIGAVESVKLLLAHGAKVDAPSEYGMTALHWAASGNWKELVELLLKAGADVNLRDGNGKTALDMAIAARSPNLGVPLAFPPPAPTTSTFASRGQSQIAKSSETKSADIAGLLREHGALDDLPDFTRIRITRQGFDRPLVVFSKAAKLTNHFSLLETVMKFYDQSGVGGPGPARPGYAALPFPDFSRILIQRPSPKPGGKAQEIKVSLLNRSNVVDCAQDVPVEFGDVIEIPERVHALNEHWSDPFQAVKGGLSAVKSQAHLAQTMTKTLGSTTNSTTAFYAKIAADSATAAQQWACLQKSVQLVVAGTTVSLTVDSWQEGFLSQALAKTEARAALRSSSDLSRVQVKRKDASSGKLVVMTVDATDASDSLWLQDGDVLEVPDKL